VGDPFALLCSGATTWWAPTRVTMVPYWPLMAVAQMSGMTGSFRMRRCGGSGGRPQRDRGDDVDLRLHAVPPRLRRSRTSPPTTARLQPQPARLADQRFHPVLPLRHRCMMPMTPGLVAVRMTGAAIRPRRRMPDWSAAVVFVERLRAPVRLSEWSCEGRVRPHVFGRIGRSDISGVRNSPARE